MQHDLNGVGFMSELSPGVSVLKNVLPILRHAHPTQFCFGHWMDNPSEMVNGKFCGSPSRIQKCSLSTLGISRWDCRTNSDPNPGHSPSHRRHHQGSSVQARHRSSFLWLSSCQKPTSGAACKGSKSCQTGSGGRWAVPTPPSTLRDSG